MFWAQSTTRGYTRADIRSGISVHELISTLKKGKAYEENEWSNILPKSPQASKKPPQPPFFQQGSRQFTDGAARKLNKIKAGQSDAQTSSWRSTSQSLNQSLPQTDWELICCPCAEPGKRLWGRRRVVLLWELPWTYELGVLVTCKVHLEWSVVWTV